MKCFAGDINCSKSIIAVSVVKMRGCCEFFQEIQHSHSYMIHTFYMVTCGHTDLETLGMVKGRWGKAAYIHKLHQEWIFN